MRIAGTISFVMVAALLAASAAFAGSRADLGRAAERLDESARLVAQRSDDVSPIFQAEAHEFSRVATDFHNSVQTPSVSDANLSAQFKQVARSYHRFRDQVARANTQEARADLDTVTAPYLDVERDLGIKPESDSGTASK
jgi:hypothetical protein